MSELPAAQQLALENWAGNAIKAGWLPNDAAESLQDAVVASPSHLFETSNRPLVVGLFGGTGVGKSTLLNRFAGEAIARASAERPTSRDITVYVHRSISVDKLPDNFPMHKMRTALHSNAELKHVMFIDMPDFDSVETANRELVDTWLPHLDVVLYVVSPDRYRDDQGWRLLLEHVTQHAWLFVMNHWDRGDPRQLEDFRAQLAAAGLHDPVLFHTDSSSQPNKDTDQFNALHTFIQNAADHSIISSLEELGVVARLKSLRDLSEPWLTQLGSESTFKTLAKQWDSHWDSHSSLIKDSQAFKFKQYAENFAEPGGFWFKRLRGEMAQSKETPPADTLVDEALLARLDNGVADFIHQQAQTLNLPSAAIKQRVAEPYALARRDIATTLSTQVEKSLALPGNAFHRWVHKLLGFLTIILPLASMAWIGYRVVNAFVEGGSNPAAYLGSSFTINAALLVALAWGLPAFLQAKTRPSQVRAALRGLNLGLDAALLLIKNANTQALTDLAQQSSQLSAEYSELWQNIAGANSDNLPDPVRRMLADEVSGSVQRALDVRANTHNSTDKAPVS